MTTDEAMRACGPDCTPETCAGRLPCNGCGGMGIWVEGGGVCSTCGGTGSEPGGHDLEAQASYQDWYDFVGVELPAWDEDSPVGCYHWPYSEDRPCPACLGVDVGGLPDLADEPWAFGRFGDGSGSRGHAPRSLFVVWEQLTAWECDPRTRLAEALAVPRHQSGRRRDPLPARCGSWFVRYRPGADRWDRIDAAQFRLGKIRAVDDALSICEITMPLRVMRERLRLQERGDV